MIEYLESHMLPCQVKAWTGFDCPGCGFQRAFIDLLSGNIGDSFIHFPPLIPIILFFMVLIMKRLITKKYSLNASNVALKYTAVIAVVFILGNYTVKIITGNI